MKYSGIFLVLPIFLHLCLVSCDSLKDESYYKETKTEIENKELQITSLTSKDFLQSRGDLSKMAEFLSDEGIFEQLELKNQLHTLLVVDNTDFSKPLNSDTASIIANAHVSDIAISPANLFDGETIMMWHGKYVRIGIDSLGQEGHIVGHITMDSGHVKEVIKTADGYIYVISKMVKVTTSLLDYINALPDEYSQFKKMVIECGTRKFDKQNSIAICINEEGNTVYDSVFVYRSNLFESKGIDLNSESINMTMLLFSNKVIEEAKVEARKTLTHWGRTRDEAKFDKWILKSAFFDQIYQPEEIMSKDTFDLFSIFDVQWRIPVQKVDTSNYTNLSNGRVYKVTNLHLPKNLLIYRIKEYYNYYEICDDNEKNKYFKTTNLKFHYMKDDVAEWSPIPGILPYHKNRLLYYKCEGGVNSSFNVDMMCLEKCTRSSGLSGVQPISIPPGAYRLAMGFKRSLNVYLVVDVIVNNEVVATSNPFLIDTSMLYQYDRSSKLDNCYIEDWSEIVAEYGPVTTSGVYDADGGPVFDEVIIPDVNGDGSPVNIRLNVRCSDRNGLDLFPLHHWCLRPTVNSY